MQQTSTLNTPPQNILALWPWHSNCNHGCHAPLPSLFSSFFVPVLVTFGGYPTDLLFHTTLPAGKHSLPDFTFTIAGMAVLLQSHFVECRQTLVPSGRVENGNAGWRRKPGFRFVQHHVRLIFCCCIPAT